uniref:Uncharacterized protein n=1 Tax=Cacopsylla melanoneura TaxID=428564 RepID=A0A8D9DWH5_9HEMI
MNGLCSERPFKKGSPKKNLKERFREVGVPKFYEFLEPDGEKYKVIFCTSDEKYKELQIFVAQILCNLLWQFEVLNSCFSKLKEAKTEQRTILTDKNLSDTIKVSDNNSCVPNFKYLVREKRC